LQGRHGHAKERTLNPRKSIPSMFHRRLLLLAAAFALVMFVLSLQMFRLSVVEGSARRAAAEERLETREYLPTYRAALVDRQGRVLAVDRASDDLAFHFSVITGAWARGEASAAAKKALGRAKWNTLSPQQREARIEERLPEFRQQQEWLYQEVCRICGVEREELQRRMDQIKETVQASRAVTWERQLRREQEQFGITEEQFKPEPILEQTSTHVLAPHVSTEQAFELRRLAQQFPGMIEVRAARRREYPWQTARVPLERHSLPREIRSDQTQVIEVIGVADHILGSVRDEAWAEDLARRPFERATGDVDLGGYLPRDPVGARGIERVFEDVLRGQRGEIRQRVDTGEKIRTEPHPGRDVHLTLDIALQARVQAILSHDFGLTVVQPWQQNMRLPVGTPLNAAAVVVEVETGEIMAMVSMPTIAMGDAMTQRDRQIHTPIVNRACEAVYPPGSIIKPLTLAAAVGEGVQNLDAKITCTGHYFPGSETTARCWIYRTDYGMRTHGDLKAEEALARSCNIFFYTLADHLGVTRFRKWLGSFGVGQHLNIGLTARGPNGKIIWTGEHSGELPSDAHIAKWREARETKYNEVVMGIGQGPITWTPLHAANAYATLARGGTIRDATLIADDPRGSRPRRGDDLDLKPQLVSAAIEGLRQSVEEQFGTGHHITRPNEPWEVILNASGVTTWAKTGTAQAPAWRTEDTNNDGKINLDDVGIPRLDHSWFVGLVGPKNGKPQYAVAVLVEYGGSGGRTSGPIANQIIRALQTEGYLPGDPHSPPPPPGHMVGDEPEDDGEDDGGDA
jgi:penicillin-binding protein 2